MSKERGSKCGLSLLEVLVGMLILGVLVVACLRTLGLSSAMGSMQQNRQRAMNLAQRRMEELLQTDYRNLPQGVTLQVYDGEVPGGDLYIQTIVTDVDDPGFSGLYSDPLKDPDVDYKQIVINTWWHQKIPADIGSMSFRMHTYVSPHVQTIPAEPE